MQYAILAWGGSNESKLQRINIIHNSIIRLLASHIAPRDFRLSNDTLYKFLNLLKLQDIYNFESEIHAQSC